MLLSSVIVPENCTFLFVKLSSANEMEVLANCYNACTQLVSPHGIHISKKDTTLCITNDECFAFCLAEYQIEMDMLIDPLHILLNPLIPDSYGNFIKLDE